MGRRQVSTGLIRRVLAWESEIGNSHAGDHHIEKTEIRAVTRDKDVYFDLTAVIKVLRGPDKSNFEFVPLVNASVAVLKVSVKRLVPDKPISLKDIRFVYSDSAYGLMIRQKGEFLVNILFLSVYETDKKNSVSMDFWANPIDPPSNVMEVYVAADRQMRVKVSGSVNLQEQPVPSLDEALSRNLDTLDDDDDDGSWVSEDGSGQTDENNRLLDALWDSDAFGEAEEGEECSEPDPYVDQSSDQVVSGTFMKLERRAQASSGQARNTRPGTTPAGGGQIEVGESSSTDDDFDEIEDDSYLQERTAMLPGEPPMFSVADNVPNMKPMLPGEPPMFSVAQEEAVGGEVLDTAKVAFMEPMLPGEPPMFSVEQEKTVADDVLSMEQMLPGEPPMAEMFPPAPPTLDMLAEEQMLGLAQTAPFESSLLDVVDDDPMFLKEEFKKSPVPLEKVSLSSQENLCEPPGCYYDVSFYDEKYTNFMDLLPGIPNENLHYGKEPIKTGTSSSTRPRRRGGYTRSVHLFRYRVENGESCLVTWTGESREFSEISRSVAAGGSSTQKLSVAQRIDTVASFYDTHVSITLYIHNEISGGAVSFVAVDLGNLRLSEHDMGRITDVKCRQMRKFRFSRRSGVLTVYLSEAVRENLDVTVQLEFVPSQDSVEFGSVSPAGGDFYTREGGTLILADYSSYRTTSLVSKTGLSSTQYRRVSHTYPPEHRVIYSGKFTNTFSCTVLREDMDAAPVQSSHTFISSAEFHVTVTEAGDIFFGIEIEVKNESLDQFLTVRNFGGEIWTCTKKRSGDVVKPLENPPDKESFLVPLDLSKDPVVYQLVLVRRVGAPGDVLRRISIALPTFEVDIESMSLTLYVPSAFEADSVKFEDTGPLYPDREPKKSKQEVEKEFFGMSQQAVPFIEGEYQAEEYLDDVDAYPVLEQSVGMRMPPPPSEMVRGVSSISLDPVLPHGTKFDFRSGLVRGGTEIRLRTRGRLKPASKWVCDGCRAVPALVMNHLGEALLFLAFAFIVYFVFKSGILAYF